jgi:hypothetical protein
VVGVSDRDTGSASDTEQPTADDDSDRVDESGAADGGGDESGSVDTGTGTGTGTDPTASDGGGETASEDRFGTGRPVTYLTWAGVAVLAVTALVALFGFYTGVSRAISVWVSSSYRPIVNAGFNLALLLAALGGIGLLLRRTD